MDWKNKKTFLLIFVLVIGLVCCSSHAQTVQIINDSSGSKLLVDGKPFMIKGMNWDYTPIGQNYSYNFWGKSDDFIKTALDSEMNLLKNMGVNTIRHYVGIPPRWVKYIYETYGIYTVVNHTLGRYGVTIDGTWIPSTDYSDPKTREMLKAEVKSMIDSYKDTPGMLFWLLGNENNYGLTWTSAETEALPKEERQVAKAHYMYSLFSEVTDMIKSVDNRPVAMANGDLLYIDVIKEEYKNLDMLGMNVYRGISARDAFEVVKKKLGIPLLFSEFGSDAFNMKTMSEDQYMQARYLIGQWEEIYEQSYGKGRIGNAVGGFTFQFSDGWWKYKQEINLDIHDINASWPNGGYSEDYVEGENNMNEEWWGICAKGFPDAQGFYKLYPRAAYYALKKVNQFDPYGKGCSIKDIQSYFSTINPMDAVLEARGNKAALESSITNKVRLKGLDMRFESISTGGSLVTTPKIPLAANSGYPAFRGFDHLESFYAEFEANPSPNVRGDLTLNVLGNVPENPIDEIFYENRGRTKTFNTIDGEVQLNGLERVKVYNASVFWEDKWFNLDGFYRTGHYHWGYEGDFFGLYQEANYGPNIDIYNGIAPVGMEVTGKKDLLGLKAAFGPELWWGANPTVLFKYQHQVGSVLATAIYQKDIDKQGKAVTSSAIPLPTTKKATLHLFKQKGNLTMEVGGIWSGANKKGEEYTYFKDDNPNLYYRNTIKPRDAYGAKFKMTYHKGRYSWYLQGASMGLVADGGPTAVQTFSGWQLKDSGKGNQRNIFTGVSMRFGNLEVAPNFAWQKPLRGPIPDVPRNVLDDPFAVRENREMTAFELLLTYDPTPATWMYQWDNDIREDAYFAMTFGTIIKDLPTTTDAGLFFDSAAGNPIYAFPAGSPPRKIGSLSNLFRDHIWELYARIISKPIHDFGLIANLLYGTGEPNGNDPRLIKRYVTDIRVVYKKSKLQTVFKLNDWGPYDYHRDHNLTYPIQWIGDLSTGIGSPDWFDRPQTKIGIKFTYRTLDQYSPRYNPPMIPGPGDIMFPDPTAGDGSEWEIRTYLHFNVKM